MTLANSQTHYGSVTKTFHWVTAILILILMPLGSIANGAPFETSEELARKAWLFSLHKTLGVAVFFVALLRIGWAISQPKPLPLHPERKLETFAAEVAHWLLYGSLVLVPLSGWIHHAATTGFAPIWWPFGQELLFVPKDENLAHLAGDIHWIWTKVLLVTLLAHVGGALKHVVIDKDETLKRMWFGTIGKLDLGEDKKAITPSIVAAFLFAASAAFVALGSSQTETEASASLEQVSSEWEVQDGTIEITVTQFGSPVTGNFGEWTSSISYDPATKTGNVETTIAIPSLTLGSVTGQAMGTDFFDAENHPNAIFAADISEIEGILTASGRLTVKGTSIPLTLPFVLETDGMTARMTGETSVNRLDFGVGASMADETNLKFEVSIRVELTAQLQI